MKRIYILSHPQARQRAVEAIKDAPEGYTVTLAEPRRSTDQNSRMWALLTDISDQVIWHGKRLTPEDWKMVFTASLRRLEVVPNLDSTGFVALGLSTSKMCKRELSDLMTLIEAFGAERDVQWTDERQAA